MSFAIPKSQAVKQVNLIKNANNLVEKPVLAISPKTHFEMKNKMQIAFKIQPANFKIQ